MPAKSSNLTDYLSTVMSKDKISVGRPSPATSSFLSLISLKTKMPAKSSNLTDYLSTMISNTKIHLRDQVQQLDHF